MIASTRDTVLQGVHLPAGSKLGVCLLSANRDENEWPHPERFDLTRRDQGAHRAELTPDQLREAFDAVVLATGLPTDADPGVPGGDLPAVLDAGGVTRWLNGDPGECAGRTDSGTLLGGSTVVIGRGNVAMDVIRLLAKRATDLAGSVITAVGFTEGPDALLPQSALDAGCRNTGRVGDGLYAVGCLRRAPAVPVTVRAVRGR
ncbi:cytochrome P450 [Kocuria marina]|uniref:cytochrome P450 n=1 Tax=Kocuria marina TaxID=223184 RepID=UPI003828DA80